MNPPYFRAPWSATLKISTAILTIMLVVAMIISGPVGALLCAALYSAYLLSMVTGYSVQPGKIVVHGLLWRKAFDLCELQDIQVQPNITNNSVRGFRLSSIFSSMGYFSNQELGRYLGYVTDPQNAVVLNFISQRVVVTPDDPHAFREAVMVEYHRIHL
jgi:hypothetical protein